MQSPAVPTMAMGALARTPPAMMAKPSLLLGHCESSGQRGSACAASAWRTRGGAELHAQAAQLH
eukprot:9546893-Alexandrium_andersonii.AAC.1